MGPLGPALAGCLIWSGIAWGWRVFEGGPMPLLLFVAAFLWVGFTARDPRLTEGGRYMAGGEQWGIVLAAVVAIFSYGLRWY